MTAEADRLAGLLDRLPRDENQRLRFTPAAVLFPLYQHEGQICTFVLLRPEAMTTHAGQYAFPGGRIEPGETAEQAALREAAEEVNLDARLVRLLGRLPYVYTPSGFAITPVVGWLREKPVLRLAPEEAREIVELPVAWLRQPQNVVQQPLDLDIGRQELYFYQYGAHLIWGATAHMIKTLMDLAYP
jgi:8-oxo-dGTP pyrophosphatase MutT (NUDIX family)